MTDYQRLVDFFMDEIPVDSPFEGKIKYLVEKLIAEGVTFQKWISVTERLPDEDGSYLVTTTTGAVTTARYYVSKTFPATKLLPEYTSQAKWQSNRDVTHWMPLPEPPKEE